MGYQKQRAKLGIAIESFKEDQPFHEKLRNPKYRVSGLNTAPKKKKIKKRYR